MKDSIRRIFLLLSLLALSWGAYAQKVTFEVNSPPVVAVGEVFRVEFVASTKPKNFIAPTFGEGIDVIAGPTLSTSRLTSIVNGSVTQVNNHSYTYVLQLNGEGTFIIPAASIEAGGKTYSTKVVKVQAVAEQAPQQNAAATVEGEARPTATLAPDDILLRAVVDKTEVYKGEQVKITYKLYTRVRLNIESARFPSYNGFWSQQLNVDGYTQQRETYNGKVYDTHILREDLLFPQQPGVLSIDEMEMTAIAQLIVQRRRQSVFDDFFGGAADVQEIRRKVSTDEVRITVKDLPAGAPGSFGGAVGEFQMETIMPSREVAMNSALTYGIKLSGSGNFPQIQAPKVSLPTSFEQYNVKTTESLNNTSRGIYGYRQFEYPLIPRVSGDYEIGPVEFTYFNPNLVRYETLRTPAVTVRVQQDSTRMTTSGTIVSGLSKEDVKILGQDIRFIKLGNSNLKPRGVVIFGSWPYWIIIVLLSGLSVFLFFYLRKALAERRNTALLKGKRANKVALQRLRAAEKYMSEDNQRGFYEEMLKALWGYMSDKLNIPSSNLTKENIREELIRKSVSSDEAERYVEIIADCEYAQYAPAATGKMHETYTRAVEIISKLESYIGK